MSARVPMFLSLILLSSAACGGGAASAPTTPEALAAAFDDAYCESMVGCRQMPDLETCRAVFFAERDARTKTLAAAVAAGTVVLDADAAAECLEFARSYSCSSSGDAADSGGGDACADMYRGQVAAGGACAIYEECGDDLYCKFPEGCQPLTMCCQGACEAPPAPPPLPGVGEDCTEIGACVDGAWCHFDFETGMGACEARAAEGAACADFDACALDLICDLDFSAMTGTCKKPAGEGGACSPDGFGACDRYDNYCDATSKTCVALKGPGDACADGNECQSWTGCIDGACKARPALGGACSDTERCLGDLRCEGGRCVEPKDEEACPLSP